MQEGKALMKKEIYQRYNSRDEIDDKQIHKNSTEEARKKTRRKMNVRTRLKVFSIRSGLDLPFLFITITLVVVGLIMLFSASYPIDITIAIIL